MKKIILIGAGGHAKSVVDSIEQAAEYEIVGFSDNPISHKEIYRDYKVICTDEDLEKIYTAGVKNAFITVGYMGNSSVREKIYNKLRSIGFNIPTIIDSSAVIARDVKIGAGCFIGKTAVINSQARIGDLGIINTAAVIEHECDIGFNVHLAGNSILCGNVTVGNDVFIGAGSVVIQGINIGSDVIIGAASTVIHNVKDHSKLFGIV